MAGKGNSPRRSLAGRRTIGRDGPDPGEGVVGRSGTAGGRREPSRGHRDHRRPSRCPQQGGRLHAAVREYRRPGRRRRLLARARAVRSGQGFCPDRPACRDGLHPDRTPQCRDPQLPRIHRPCPEPGETAGRRWLDRQRRHQRHSLRLADPPSASEPDQDCLQRYCAPRRRPDRRPPAGRFGRPIAGPTLLQGRQAASAGHREAQAVALANGLPPGPTPEERLARTAQVAASGRFRTSMLQDRAAGKSLELEPIVGAVLELARRRALSTPTLERLYAEARQLTT